MLSFLYLQPAVFLSNSANLGLAILLKASLLRSSIKDIQTLEVRK
jgi:hypothetical protein